MTNRRITHPRGGALLPRMPQPEKGAFVHGPHDECMDVAPPTDGPPAWVSSARALADQVEQVLAAHRHYASGEGLLDVRTDPQIQRDVAAPHRERLAEHIDGWQRMISIMASAYQRTAEIQEEVPRARCRSVLDAVFSPPTLPPHA